MIKQTRSERWFDAMNVAVLLLLAAAILIPLIHVLAVSLSETTALNRSEVKLWPIGFNLDNYLLVLKNKRFVNAFLVTLLVVAAGTLLNMALTTMTAYPLSRTYFQARRWMTLLVIFTMIFQAPLIPMYLLVRSFGLLDTLGALIVPSAISVFNMILCMTFFRSLPEELLEAARIDGMSEFNILLRIVMPLSRPILYTLLLFYAVYHWNNYFSSLIFITDPAKRPLQLYIFMMLNRDEASTTMSNLTQIMNLDVSPKGLQMATVVLATAPIVMIYPFIQKHFIKGSLIGSLKE